MDILAMETTVSFILTIVIKRVIYSLRLSYLKATVVTTPCVNLAPSECV